uniref:Uncharacterized protein n=1 Tax=Setaria digitata TaxID=48799 RepID=A0A915PET5_9BILA
MEISTPSSSTDLSTSLTKEVAKPSAMKLQYVTERIIVALFPSDSTDAQYRTDLKDATVLLRRKHAEHYKIFNISKRRSDLGRLHSVIELGWPEELAPPLDRLCAICKLLENWLSANSANVVVIHCKGGCSRAAIVIASYMHYITICSVDESIGIRFALQQFSERYLGPDGQPSHKRLEGTKLSAEFSLLLKQLKTCIEGRLKYVKYFSSLLCGRTKIQPATVYLHNIVLTNFLGRNVLFKIYERMQPVHTTSLKTVNESETFELGNLPLRGDILVKCFQRTSSAERTLFFRCQFNTCTFDLSTSHNENVYKLRFYREELDDIFNDSEVNSQAMIEFIFQRELPKSSSDDANGCCDDVARTSIADYSRADSYENFDKEEGW